MNFDRRNFFTSIALGVGATAFPNFIKDFDKLKPVNISGQLNDQTRAAPVSKFSPNKPGIENICKPTLPRRASRSSGWS